MKKKLFVLALIMLFLPMFVKADMLMNPTIVEYISKMPGITYEGDDIDYNNPPDFYLELPFDLERAISDNELTMDFINDYCDSSDGCLKFDTDHYVKADRQEVLNDMDTGGNAILEIYLNNIWKDELAKLGYDAGIWVSNIDTDANVFTVSFNIFESGYMNSYEVFYSYNKQLDQDILSRATTLFNSIDNVYVNTDMIYINNVFHYGSLYDTYSDPVKLIYQNPELKDIIEKEEEFEFGIYSVGGLGTGNMSSLNTILVIKKDDVIYSIKLIYFINMHTFYIDESAEGTMKDRAEARLKDYVKDEEFELMCYPEDAIGEWNILVNGEIKPLLTCDLEYKNEHLPLMILEAPSSYVSELNVHALDAITGIEIDTSGYEVPVDVELTAEDLKNADNIKSILAKYNYDMIDAYNINLRGRKGNSQVKTIQDGVTVFIPIKGYNAGDKITVRHIKDDGSIGETLEAIVVERNGKLYAKFVTTHFSTYALVSDTVATTNNPETVDTIVYYVAIFFISLISLIRLLYVYKKNY